MFTLDLKNVMTDLKRQNPHGLHANKQCSMFDVLNI